MDCDKSSIYRVSKTLCVSQHQIRKENSPRTMETTKFKIGHFMNRETYSNDTEKTDKLSGSSSKTNVTRMISAQTLVNSALAAYIQQQQQAKLLVNNKK